MLEDRDGAIWLGTAWGLFRYDPSLAGAQAFTRFMHNPDDPASLSDNSVDALYEDHQGTLWVGTQGLNRFNRTTGTFDSFYVDPDALGSRAPDAQEVIRIEEIVEDHTGTLWVEANGLNRFDRATGTFTSYRHNPSDRTSLASNSLRALYEDRQGILWIGHTNRGINWFDRTARPFTLYRPVPADPNSLQGSMPLGIFLDRDEVLWIGTSDGVLNRLDRKTGIYTHYRHDPADPSSLGAGGIPAVLRDRRGRLWIATSRGGLNLFDEARGRFTAYRHDPNNPQSINSNTAVLLNEDRSGRLWVGTPNGLNRFNAETGTFTHYRHDSNNPNSLASDQILSLYEDRSGMIWVGTPFGLNRLDPETGVVTRFLPDPDDPASLSNPTILGLYERPQEPGILWVGTSLGGLNRLDTRTERVTHTYTAQNSGLPDNQVNAIQGDDEGGLWMSTDRGIARFDPDAPEDEAWKIFDTDDGLQSLEFHIASHQAYNGELFFGGRGGVNALRPGDSFDNPHPPEVALTELRLFNQPVEPGPESPLQVPLMQTEALTLAHDQNDVTLAYAGLHFRNPEKNQYAYRLEGYDPGWREVGGLRQATYTGLPPGRYTFRVKASNSDGVWNEAGASLALTILPPWWRTWWAYLMYGMLFIGAVFALDRGQRRRVIRKEQEKARAHELEQAKEIEKAHVELQESHAHLKATQQQLIQSEKMASLGQLTAGIAHEIKNPLNFINNFAEVNEELADELREDLAGHPDALAAVEDLLADLKQNARVINQHGKRADAIVHAMMQHASGGKGQRIATDINQLVSEHIDLAYHGKRAQVPGLTVEIERDLSENTGAVDVVPQEVGRVLLNLLGNAFDAVHEKGDVGTWGGGNTEKEYVPTVTVSTRRVDEGIEIRVSDNGPGIPKDLLEKIFEPFFTTKPTGSGTGLGLSLSYDIVAQGHGGTLVVESEEGKGATFIVRLPLS